MIHTGPMLSFDTETTGLDVENDRVVQYGLVDIPGPNVRTILVNPGIEISKQAVETHGITNERAIAEGHNPAEVVESVIDAIYAAWSSDVPLVVFNAPYDLSLLDRESRRHLDRPFEIAGPVIDPLVLARAHVRIVGQKGAYQLGNLCTRFNIKHEAAHDAGGDALASARLLWKLCNQGIDVTISPLDTGMRTTRLSHDEVPRDQVLPLANVPLDWLMSAQARWHKYWADGLGRWLKSKGRTDDVNRLWPIIPWESR